MYFLSIFDGKIHIKNHSLARQQYGSYRNGIRTEFLSNAENFCLYDKKLWLENSYGLCCKSFFVITVHCNTSTRSVVFKKPDSTAHSNFSLKTFVVCVFHVKDFFFLFYFASITALRTQS